MMRRVAPRARSPLRASLLRRAPAPRPTCSASPSARAPSPLRLGVAALFAGSALAAFVAALGSARADEGAHNTASKHKEGDLATSQQWWTAPTALGKALLLAEELVRILVDTRDMFVETHTAVRETLANVRHRIQYVHKKVIIPYYLLPPPLPPGAQKPLTLVIDFDLFFHAPPERILRAGFDYFLTQASDFCEIVVVSNQRAKGISELMQGIDPLGLISFRLSVEHFYDETINYPLADVKYLVDLERLRRDLRHVVVVTSTPDLYPRHSENVLVVSDRSWHLDADDRGLYELVPVLMHLSQQRDVRRVLPRYDGLNVTALTRAHVELYDEHEAEASDSADSSDSSDVSEL